MLRYLNSGDRWFGDVPILPHGRAAWEIYAVIEGACGILLGDGTKLPVRSSHLWVFPPQVAHGWHGLLGKPCSIICFHFGSVPAQLQEVIGAEGRFERSLVADECDELESIVTSIQKDYEHPTDLSSVRFQRALLEITLLALHEAQDDQLSTAWRKTEQKVEAALSWFRQNIRRSPSLAEVACAIHISPSYLRRLFLQVRHSSPSEALLAVKLETAQHSLTGSDLKLEAVAAESGFKSASDFSRVFKARFGCTPKEWRQRVPILEARAPFDAAASRGKNPVLSGTDDLMRQSFKQKK